MYAGAFVFLITHINATAEKVSKLVFDLGVPKDIDGDLPPATSELIKTWGTTVTVDHSSTSNLITGTDLHSSLFFCVSETAPNPPTGRF